MGRINISNIRWIGTTRIKSRNQYRKTSWISISGAVGSEAVGGGAGEATAQIATGEEISPGEVLLEGVAEIPIGGVQVLSALRNPNQQQTETEPTDPDDTDGGDSDNTFTIDAIIKKGKFELEGKRFNTANSEGKKVKVLMTENNEFAEDAPDGFIVVDDNGIKKTIPEDLIDFNVKEEETTTDDDGDDGDGSGGEIEDFNNESESEETDEEIANLADDSEEVETEETQTPISGDELNEILENSEPVSEQSESESESEDSQGDEETKPINTKPETPITGTKISDVPIEVTNIKGSVRFEPKNKKDRNKARLPADYGHIKGVKGADGENLDAYVAGSNNLNVFVVDQIDPETGNFDEHKVIFGIANKKDAENLYRRAHLTDPKGSQRLGYISKVPWQEFIEWVNSGELDKPYHYNKGNEPVYKSVLSKRIEANISHRIDENYPGVSSQN